MRSLIACGSAALAAMIAVACATSETSEGTPPPDAGDRQTIIRDAGADDAEPDAPAPTADGPMCSPAGWCKTALPDEDLVMFDIWPLAGRAFAIAGSATVGIKILEWKDADASWAYIDDGTQNEPGIGTFAGKIWAPNENEVYFGVGPAYVYHGRRPTPPATTWSWTRHRLPDNEHVSYTPPIALVRHDPVLGVWGTSSSDVHAWFKNTIFRLNRSGGGVEEWIPEYVADDVDDPNEYVHFVSAAGTSSDDVWFSGARTRSNRRCALLVRRSTSGFERIADGALLDGSAECTPRDGALMIGGAEGWLTELQAVGGGRFVGLKGDRDLVRISADGSSYRVDIASVPTSSLGLTDSEYFVSLWSGPKFTWLASGVGLVARGSDVWSGGNYEISTLALNGAPVVRALHHIKGTSDTNLWAIGDRNALHKTSP